MVDLVKSISKSNQKFKLDLRGKTVLTEAASGNYVVTPIIAAIAGAKKVYAYTKNSQYGTIEEVVKQTTQLANLCNVETIIKIVTNLNDVNFHDIDILTNTGFLRPINSDIIDNLKTNCVIPLMWETWEFRKDDLDLEACHSKGIKVYGTNEDDDRLKTKEYIGYMVLKFLLDLKHTPMSSNILVLGCDYFNPYIEKVLNQNNYNYLLIDRYDEKIDVSKFEVIVLAEHYKEDLLIGRNAFIDVEELHRNIDVIHICGNVDFTGATFNYIPEKPAKFGYMSYTADYMGVEVVIDLHTAGLKVAEGMLKANEMDLDKESYKKFMEKYYPVTAFEDKRYW